jgi:hypothetical protein
MTDVRVTLLPDPEQRDVRYRLISVDDHLIEPPDLFEGRMPAALADRAPKVVTFPTARKRGSTRAGCIPTSA